MRPVDRRRRLLAACGALLVLCSLLLAPATPARAANHSGACTDADGVTVVVDFQQLGGGTVVRCADDFAGGSGLDALSGAGFSHDGVKRWGDAFICRLEGKPAAGTAIPVAGNSGYRERCIDTPPAAAYWSYWHATDGGSWTYSQQGITNRQAVPGGFEGWSFSLNAGSSSNAQPRLTPARPEPEPTQTSAPEPSRTSEPAPDTQPPTSAPPSRDRDPGSDGQQREETSASQEGGQGSREAGAPRGSDRDSSTAEGSDPDRGADTGASTGPSSTTATGSNGSRGGADGEVGDAAAASPDPRSSSSPGSDATPSPTPSAEPGASSASPSPVGSPTARSSPRSGATPPGDGGEIGAAGAAGAEDPGVAASPADPDGSGPPTGLVVGLGALAVGAVVAGLIGWRRARS